jgi:excisionase family DNA binding protein
VNTLVQPVAYTVRDCASALRCSERTIHRLVKSGTLAPVIRIGRLLRIPAESLRRFVERPGHQEQTTAALAGMR